MEHLDFHPHDTGGLFELGDFTNNDQRPPSYPPFSTPTAQSQSWRDLGTQGMDKEDNMYCHSQYHSTFAIAGAGEQEQRHPAPRNEEAYSRPNSNHSHQTFNVPSTGVDFEYPLCPSHWHVPLHQAAQQNQQHQHHAQCQVLYPQHALQSFNVHANGQLQLEPAINVPFGGPMALSHASLTYPISTGIDQAQLVSATGHTEPINTLVYPFSVLPPDSAPQVPLNDAALRQQALNQQAIDGAKHGVAGSSPLSDGWSFVDLPTNFNPNRNSMESSSGCVSNPGERLHIHTDSSSSSSADDLNSAELSASWDEHNPWLLDHPGHPYLDYLQSSHGLPTGQVHAQAFLGSHSVSPENESAFYGSSGSSGSLSTSPTSSVPTSPQARRRKAPPDAKSPKGVKKNPSSSRAAAEKRIGRRKGPLKPEQRTAAHEIRKLRACLRCKFLKKTCDKGEPCGGCRPSHARLWQVPCTRMDIREIAYFMKDWKADYERHVSLGFSVGNIKGFSSLERTLYITHGYGHYLPINAREVFVRDDKCFGVDWVESIHETPLAFEINTARLSAGVEGVSTTVLSDYLDRHLDHGFENFVDEHFEGTPFLTEILKTAYRYYQRERNTAVRDALKLVIAYNLTLQVTMVEGLSEEEQFSGKIEHEASRYCGKTVAPVMINFQVKCALADMWRDLQAKILAELSSLYSSVYSGDKLKNWPTIFMLAAILLAIWEEMQFDCCYRVPDETAVNNFCDEMETTPVGVIVGLFQAISTKLPGLQEWDTKKHHHLLGSNPAVCDALTEVKGHVNKYETYLKDRQNAKYDRNDFDSLSNKFLSKLVIRAN